jgi:hypothetical protein
MLRSLHAALSIEQYTAGISRGSGSLASCMLMSSWMNIDPIMPLPTLVEGSDILIESLSFFIFAVLQALPVCTGHMLQMHLFTVLLFSGTLFSLFPTISNKSPPKTLKMRNWIVQSGE